MNKKDAARRLTELESKPYLTELPEKGTPECNELYRDLAESIALRAALEEEADPEASADSCAQ